MVFDIHWSMKWAACFAAYYAAAVKAASSVQTGLNFFLSFFFNLWALETDQAIPATEVEQNITPMSEKKGKVKRWQFSQKAWEDEA